MATLIRDLGPAYHASISPDGTRLLRERQSQAHVHDIDSGEELGVVSTGSGYSSSALIGDSSLLIDRTASATRRVFDAGDGAVVWKSRAKGKLRGDHEGDLVIARDTTTLIDPVTLASGASRIDLVDGLTGDVVSYERDAAEVKACRPAAGRDELLMLERLDDEERTHRVSWFDPGSGEAVPLPIETTLIPEHPRNAFWDARSEGVILVDTFSGLVHTGSGMRRDGVSCVSMSPDGTRLFVYADDTVFQILDASTFEVVDGIASVPSHPGDGVFSPDGSKIAVTIKNRAHLYELDAAAR